MSDDIRTLVDLLDSYELCKVPDKAEAIRVQILKLVPAAMNQCEEVGAKRDVQRAFAPVRAGLKKHATPAAFREDRSLLVPMGRISAWGHFRQRLQEVRSFKERPGDPVINYVGFATAIYHAADWACEHFPYREFDIIKFSSGREARRYRTGYVMPHEQGLVHREIVPRVTSNIRTTLLARASSAIVERGAGAFGLSKLERIHKALLGVNEHLMRGAAGGLFSAKAGQELAAAIGNAEMLMPAISDAAPTPQTKKKTVRRRRRPPTPPKALTARQVEAMQLYAEHKGDRSKAARAMGVERKTFIQHYEAGVAKLGQSDILVKPKTQRLREDRRGQVDLDEDRRRD